MDGYAGQLEHKYRERIQQRRMAGQVSPHRTCDFALPDLNHGGHGDLIKGMSHILRMAWDVEWTIITCL